MKNETCFYSFKLNAFEDIIIFCRKSDLKKYCGFTDEMMQDVKKLQYSYGYKNAESEPYNWRSKCDLFLRDVKGRIKTEYSYDGLSRKIW